MSGREKKEVMIITVTKALMYTDAYSLCSVCSYLYRDLAISAFADWVTVSTVNSASYFQTFSSKGSLDCNRHSAHYINETGQVAYCLSD